MTYIAIDVHKSSSTFAALIPATGEISRQTAKTNYKRFAQILGKLPKPWIVAVEATRESPAVCTWLEQIGAEIHLVDPQTMSVLGKLRIAKTDMKDAELMLEALVNDYLPECYLAPPEVVERRALIRGHQALRKEATRFRNLIRIAFCQAGMECTSKDLTGKAARSLVPELIAELPDYARLVTEQYWELLNRTEAAPAEIDKQIAAEVKADPVAAEFTEEPGVGPITAFGMIAEIGEITRFGQDKKLHSYAGVVPRTIRSSDFSGKGHLPQRCNKRLRNLAVLAAQSAGRSTKSSKANQTYARVKSRCGSNSGKIAAARVILSRLYHIWHAHLADTEALAA